MVVDKNAAIISFLLNCPVIADNPLFFNFINAKDNNNQIITSGNDTALQVKYVDGSMLKEYIFTIVLFKSVSQNAVVKIEGYPDENVSDLADVQSLIDWINEEASIYNYPNFGEDCIVDSMETLTSTPVLEDVDTSVQPALGRYSIAIRITYLDTSKVICQ